jgi:hypothetical protein
VLERVHVFRSKEWLFEADSLPVICDIYYHGFMKMSRICARNVQSHYWYCFTKYYCYPVTGIDRLLCKGRFETEGQHFELTYQQPREAEYIIRIGLGVIIGIRHKHLPLYVRSDCVEFDNTVLYSW